MVSNLRRMTLGDDPIELMQGCLFTASYDGQLRGEILMGHIIWPICGMIKNIF